MKPAVINNSSETPIQTHHDQNTNAHQQPNNGQPNNDHARRFPQFRQHGFGFDDPDGDVFADMGLRSRLNRMGNPFDWSARKRRGSGQGNADAYDHYFDDVDFPHFGSTWDAFGRMGKRSQQPHEPNDRSGFFNYVPPEFRQYVPEHFGGYFRQHSGQPYMHQQQGPPPPQQQQQQQHPQQQQPHQQPTQSQSSQPSGSKSNLCDAAIQTDDLGNPNNSNPRDDGNHPNHDNRNGMNANQSSSSASSTSTPYGNEVHMSTSADGPGAYANASAGNNQNQYYQQSPNYGRQYQQPPYGQQYQYSSQPQNQYYANQGPQHQTHQQPQQQQPQHQPAPSQQEGNVRTVPIVFETTGTPVNRTPPPASSSSSSSQTGSNKPRPEPLNKESFASNQPIPSDQPIPCPPPPSHNQQQQPEQQHSEPTAGDGAPPQTPHTADCISKIQAIQRDVLELMLAVEQFGGKRGDKDYIYLDEMLTRNLLKLDTIDTNGKESIRMARKEAIKCIQTSIAVLEAKADLHLNEKRDSVDQTTTAATAEGADAAAPSDATGEEKPAGKMDVDGANNGNDNAPAAADPSVNNDTTEIPKVENISIDDKPSTAADAPSNQDDSDSKSKDKKEKKVKKEKKEKKEKTPECTDAKK